MAKWFDGREHTGRMWGWGILCQFRFRNHNVCQHICEYIRSACSLAQTDIIFHFMASHVARRPIVGSCRKCGLYCGLLTCLFMDNFRQSRHLHTNTHTHTWHAMTLSMKAFPATNRRCRAISLCALAFGIDGGGFRVRMFGFACDRIMCLFVAYILYGCVCARAHVEQPAACRA